MGKFSPSWTTDGTLAHSQLSPSPISFKDASAAHHLFPLTLRRRKLLPHRDRIHRTARRTLGRLQTSSACSREVPVPERVRRPQRTRALSECRQYPRETTGLLFHAHPGWLALHHEGSSPPHH